MKGVIVSPIRTKGIAVPLQHVTVKCATHNCGETHTLAGYCHRKIQCVNIPLVVPNGTYAEALQWGEEHCTVSTEEEQKNYNR